MDQRLISVPEAAALLGLGRSTVYELVAAGKIRTVRIGRARRVPLNAVDEFVAALELAEERADPQGEPTAT